MTLLWLVYSLVAAYYLRLATSRPMRPTTPKSVYRFFDVLYRLSRNTASGGAIVLQMLFFSGSSFLPMDWYATLVGGTFLVIFVSIYCGER